MLRMMMLKVMLRRRTDPEPTTTLCASLRSRNTPGHVRRAALCGICRKRFARACAVETHVKISQEPLYTEIPREKCRRPE